MLPEGECRRNLPGLYVHVKGVALTTGDTNKLRQSKGLEVHLRGAFRTMRSLLDGSHNGYFSPQTVKLWLCGKLCTGLTLSSAIHVEEAVNTAAGYGLSLTKGQPTLGGVTAHRAHSDCGQIGAAHPYDQRGRSRRREWRAVAPAASRTRSGRASSNCTLMSVLAVTQTVLSQRREDQ